MSLEAFFFVGIATAIFAIFLFGSYYLCKVNTEWKEKQDGPDYFEYHFEYRVVEKDGKPTKWIMHIPILSKGAFEDSYNFSCLPYPNEVHLLKTIKHTYDKR